MIKISTEELLKAIEKLPNPDTYEGSDINLLIEERIDDDSSDKPSDYHYRELKFIKAPYMGIGKKYEWVIEI
ncbi:hypothetical protein [Flammeovirga sp. OC4]|uniref:hypothetical protein n=1 Tax=Flammeovirga sp. OC4 TaxID=1382345 RepID=UPI0005C65D67|nr:hypothetical protein [Flammeovirga sp. OC4]